MKVLATKYKDAHTDGSVEKYRLRYPEREGLTLIETKITQSRSDIEDNFYERISPDNGRTWSDWQVTRQRKDDKNYQGNHQLAYIEDVPVWNPVHKHYVTFGRQLLWLDGYESATKRFWAGDTLGRPIHTFLTVYDDQKHYGTELIRIEEGDDFDPENWANPGYTNTNYVYELGNTIVEPNGDILFTAEILMRTACKLTGRDIMEVFPSAPNAVNAVVVFRGKWNGQRYLLTPGQPIVISDRLSSRGLNEPAMAKLSSGRIVVILRGSNAKMSWPQRMDPGTPNFKWFSYSDDGGKTFSDPMPWRFDDGEVIYSSATLSQLFQDPRTGKHYWIGTVTDHTAYANFPRYPLNIVELDETYGTAKKATLTVIDTRRENEPKWIQLSNFNLIQDRETGHLILTLTKVGQFQTGESAPEGNPFHAEVWRYTIELDGSPLSPHS